MEQLRRDYTAILADCGTSLEQAKARESLRARFDSEADSLQSVLDTYHATLGLDPHQNGGTQLDMNANTGADIGKEALRLGLAEFDSRWAKGLRQLQNTLGKLKPSLEQTECSLLMARSEELENGAKALREKLTKRLAEVINFYSNLF